MDNKKMIGTIEKKTGVKVEKVLEVKQNGKEIAFEVKIGETKCLKGVLRESRNQYGVYYRFVSASEYEMKAKKPSKEAGRKLRTKTEHLCCAERKDIINFAEKNIKSLMDGSATFREIEGPAKNDTVIRFVLIQKVDGIRVKEDIDIMDIKKGILEN